MYETRIPILHALLAHLRKNPRAYHVPGHKMGRGLSGELGSWLGTTGRLDLTEIPGLDDLHAPEGAILEAQRLAAQAFGADETYFLINGSTAGNMAMIMAALRPGEKIIVPRNLHKSVLSGLILAQADPVFYHPDVDEQFGIPTGVDPQTIADTIGAHPDARAVVLVSPTYHGICSDVRAIADVVHKVGMVLLVDEAHGAHFAFHADLPETAMAGGADIAVQSTHKMLGSLTQSSMLHLQGPRIDRTRLRKKLQLVQSTSPSYLLLASLDCARYQMDTEGEALLGQAIQAVRAGAERLREIPGLQLLEQTARPYPIDPLKWTISVKDLGVTGTEAYQYLYEQHGLYLELSDPDNVLAIFSYTDGELQVQRLLDGLTALSQWAISANGNLGSERVSAPTPIFQTAHVERRIPLHLAVEMETESVPLQQAIGRVAGEMVIPYPPGIPLLTPGEVFTEEMVAHVTHLKRTGVRFQGVDDLSLEHVQVLTEHNNNDNT